MNDSSSINKINLETGRKLHDGTEILLGDKLSGARIEEVVVLFDSKINEVGVEIISHPEFWFPLDKFLSSWGDNIIKTGSVLQRKN